MRYLPPHNKCMRAVTLYLAIMMTATTTITYGQQQGDYDYGGNDYGNGDSSYQDYADPYTQPDNLYADYAATKMEGAGNKGGG
jgi:hypothetical protein